MLYLAATVGSLPEKPLRLYSHECLVLEKEAGKYSLILMVWI
jgi:hypothetical protein